MVGVPGRSKACATCRRRKKGCDFLRPSCTQCLRAGLVCGGYERGRIFVHTTQQRPSSVRESCFALAPVDRITSPDSSGSEPRSRTVSVDSNGTLTGSPNSDSIDCLCSGGLRTAAEHAPNGHTNAYDGYDGYARGSAGGYARGLVYGYAPNGLVHGHAPRFAVLPDGVVRSDVDATSPRSPNQLAPVAPRSSPGGHRVPDLCIVPVYFDHVSEGSPTSDMILVSGAEEHLLLATFWNSYLPNKSEFPMRANDFASGAWTNSVMALHREDPILHCALMANCYSAAARHGNSRYNAEMSMRAHGQALHQLRVALSNPKRARSDGVLTSLRLMIAFSMFFSDRYEDDRRARARGWKEHNAGVLALLKARGPEAHVEGHGHQMFVDCRLALIVAAIRTHKTTILSSPRWITIPWSKIAKTPKDLLIDIMASMPGILEGVDRLQEMKPGDAHDALRSTLIGLCWRLDQRLCDWYNQSSPKNRLHILELNGDDVNDDDDDDDDDDCVALPTEDLSFVYIMTVYCTACLIAYTTMQKLGIPALPPRARVGIYINKIATYLRIFFHPSTGQYGLEMTSFPLGMCLEMLAANVDTGGDRNRERAKLTRLLDTERGKEILDFLQSMLNTNETTTAP